MNKQLEKDKLESLLETIKATLVEKEYNARRELIECYYLIGAEIMSYAKANKVSEAQICVTVSQRLGRSERTFQRAVQFVKKYPNLDKLPEGKAISWHKIVNKYLPKPKEKEEEGGCKHENIMCLDCRKRL